MRLTLTSLIVLWSCAAFAAATPTPTVHDAVANRDNGCITLTDQPQLVGSGPFRQDLTYYASTGPAWCGHAPSTGATPTPNETPAPGWAKLNTGVGLSYCHFADQPLWCFGAGGVVCWAEARMVTPTPGP
jgi:hypothetical protein